MAENISSYAAGLSRDAKARYIEKISLLNGVDPFLGKIPGAEITNDLPPVDAFNLLSYLILKTSFITTAQFKARKSLEAYNQFVCGWVKDIVTKKIAGRYLTCGWVGS